MGLILANAGTALMWAAMGHFTIGNLILGLFEARLLSRFFRAGAVRASSLMVLANYLSAFGGMWLINSWLARRFEIDLYNVQLAGILLYASAYLLTLVLEWPLVYASLPMGPKRLRRSVQASLLVQTLTCAALFLWYWPVTSTPQTNGWTLLPPEQLTLPAGVRLYYISPTDGDVYRVEGRATSPERVATLHSTQWVDRLYFASIDSDVAELRWSGGPIKQSITEPLDAVVHDDEGRDSWFTFGRVPTLASTDERDWMGFWPDSGLRVSGGRPFSVNTPYVSWVVRNATGLPDGQVVLQLGEDQICLVDPKQRTAGILLRGRGPAIALSP